MTEKTPLRILIAALGGEGGGMVMNWIVNAGRLAGQVVQATSVPGVAQRTGSTSYYVEVAAIGESQSVLGLVPMPGRVDVVVSSELMETARVLTAGFISPDLTTLISSTARLYSTAEKISMGDGRYSEENIHKAAEELAKSCHMLDLNALAKANGTFVSATMFGALAGSGALPWSVAQSRAVLSDARSEAGFDAAVAAMTQPENSEAAPASQSEPQTNTVLAELASMPEGLKTVIGHGFDRMVDFQDAAYGECYLKRVRSLVAVANLTDHRMVHALTEACRRLALWMAYEDIARVADLKTRPERFERIRDEVKLEPGQVITITEYMKPRAEEIADIMPLKLGTRIMARVESGGRFPFLGRGIHVRSNGVFGYRLLRMMAALKRIRRQSYRFHYEQIAIEEWLGTMKTALPRSTEFAMALAELPRVLKGYSDTLVRGKSAYGRIMEIVVRPAVSANEEAAQARRLRDTIGAALADDTHEKLDAVLSGNMAEPAIPMLRAANV